MINTLPRWFLLTFCLAVVPSLHADNPPVRREWTVDGVVREALVYAPPQATTNAMPVVFAFHGHGGNMKQAANSFRFQMHWPAALVVYMQGLNTPGALTDPDGKKPGWQHRVGQLGDRDLKFFDAVLATLQQDYRVDDQRVYATGHSNGGFFTYLLWAARGDKLAAVAPCAAFVGPFLPQRKPKPVFHLAGEQDGLVKFAWQQATIDGLRRLNECGAGQPWENEKLCTLYPSKLGTPVVTYIHPGGHQYPPDTTTKIVKFFQAHALPQSRP